MKTNPISFSKDLYREDAMQAAVEAYAALATFRLERKESEVLIYLNAHEPSHEEQIREAFCTHVLFETIIKYREATGAKL